MPTKQEILESFKAITPPQEEENNTEESTSTEDTEDVEDEEILEQDYRHTCIQAYKSTKKPIWLFKALMEGEGGEVVYIPEFQETIIDFYEEHKTDYNMNIDFET